MYEIKTLIEFMYLFIHNFKSYFFNEYLFKYFSIQNISTLFSVKEK